MTRTQIGQVLAMGILAAFVSFAQPAPTPVVTIEQPDAQRTQQELLNLLERYPPSLRGVFALDPSLLNNQAYLAPYPALASFLKAHPEIERNPLYYVGENPFHHDGPQDPERVWENMLTDVAVLIGFCLAICLMAWLIRTFIDYRRWGRLTKVQTDAHTKILDRFSTNEDLLAYVNSSAGSKFLESSPIALDAGPRNVAAPLARILWTVQGGVVLIAAGLGLEIVSEKGSTPGYDLLHALGILGVALGIGFVISAIVSFVIARRLGLFERPKMPLTQG